jgi:twitching motility protein PilI
MSSRDALRAFQARLASRLQDAQTQGATAAWLGVEAAGDRFLIPLNHAGEIFPEVPIQVVPHARPWFLGVANLRGGVFGVVDLAGFLRQQPPRPRAEGAQATGRFLAFNEVLGVNCALKIDRLAGLRHVDAFGSSEAPGPDAPAYLGHRYVDAAGAAWQEINLQALSTDPGFLHIGV